MVNDTKIDDESVRSGASMKNSKIDRHALAQFTGIEQWFRHSVVRDVLYTEGAQYVAETAGAYWLLDEIAFAQRFVPAVAAEEFQVWKLFVRGNSTGDLFVEDGNDNLIWSKHLEFTDFPQTASNCGSPTT